MSDVLTKEKRAYMRKMTDTGKWKQEPATALLNHADEVDKELDFIKGALWSLRSVLMAEVSSSESAEFDAQNHERDYVREGGIQIGLEKAVRKLDLLLASLDLKEANIDLLEATLIVGEVDKDARPNSWGWKLRLFHSGKAHSHASILSCQLFESKEAATANAHEVAGELFLGVEKLITASCAGSGWMDPERVGP